MPLDGPLPESALGEVRIHREIYRRRSDVGGVVRSIPPKAMSLGTCGITPKARHGLGAYFAPQPPPWDDPQLLRNDEKASALAAKMGEAPAIVMCGNRVVTAGASLQEAVVLIYYLEDAARVKFECRSIGFDEAGSFFSADEAKQRATRSGGILDWMWNYLTAGN